MNQSNPPEKNQPVIVSANVVKSENTAECFKLIDDCWDYIFDHLSTDEIVKIGETCKHLLSISGDYLVKYCPELKFYMSEKEIYLIGNDKTVIIPAFYKYVTRLIIREQDLQKDALFFANKSAIDFESLKKLEFKFMSLYQPHFDCFQNVLENVETVNIYCTKIFSPKIFETLATYAPNLKSLTVKYSTWGGLLFWQNYKNLEELSYDAYSYDELEIENLKDFLENHKKLKRFNCDYHSLMENGDVLKNTAINLDAFDVSFDSFTIAVHSHVEWDNFTSKLIELYERGIFKYINISLETVLYMRELRLVSQPILNLARAIPIKELYLDKVQSGKYPDFLTSELHQLERLHIGYVSNNNEILKFVRNSKNLKSIEIGDMINDDLRLSTINNERKKNENARKLLLYINKNNYLFCKWHLKNSDLSHVQVKRNETKRF